MDPNLMGQNMKIRDYEMLYAMQWKPTKCLKTHIKPKTFQKS